MYDDEVNWFLALHCTSIVRAVHSSHSLNAMKVVVSNTTEVGGMSHSDFKYNKTLTNLCNLAINQIFFFFTEYHGLRLVRLILAVERTNSP